MLVRACRPRRKAAGLAGRRPPPARLPQSHPGPIGFSHGLFGGCPQAVSGEASKSASKQVQRATHYRPEESSSLDGKGNRLRKTGEVEWLVEGTLVPSEEWKAQLLNQKSLFIVATDELDADKLPLEEMLRGHKSQVRVERGFHFLKDPQRGPSFWRVRSGPVALLMVMTLCLLVHSALEWRIREGLQVQDVTVPDQKGNPTQRPTARWVFENLFV